MSAHIDDQDDATEEQVRLSDADQALLKVHREHRRRVAAAWVHVSAARDELFDMHRRLSDPDCSFDGEWDPCEPIQRRVDDLMAIHDGLELLGEKLPELPEDLGQLLDDEADAEFRKNDRRPWYMRTAEDRHTYDMESGGALSRESSYGDDE